MRCLLWVGAVVALACSAYAGGNPDVRIYFDFDPPNYVHSIEPEIYSTVNAYVCVDQLGEGVSSVAFRLADPTTSCPGVFAPPSWACSWHYCGPPIPPENGDIVAFNFDCVHEDPSIIGYLTLFYIGGECCLRILDNTEYPRWVVDCSDPAEVDHYCVLSHGNVGGVQCPEGDCVPVPVEVETWGTVKAMYR